MLIERIYDEDLAQASYFIGCQRTGQALVVDARPPVASHRSLRLPACLPTWPSPHPPPPSSVRSLARQNAIRSGHRQLARLAHPSTQTPVAAQHSLALG